MRFVAPAALFLVASAAIPAAAADQAIIILDASGSMWGQIDGQPKIAIAREVLGRTLYEVPSSTRLGFMAYGHREKGNCADIELFIAPAPGSAAEIEGTAKDLSPKGKTPLTDAVRQAAEALKYTEDKATVILITDGLETCDADPCSAARELEQSGVDFTAHVVGFGLSAEEGRQVACIADETGGQYFQASDAEALADALTETVAEVAEPPPPPPEPVEEAALPEATLDAPDAVEIGKTLTVGWDGPGERYDYIALVDPAGNNGEGKEVRRRRVINGDMDAREVRVTAPVTPGSYVLRYLYDRGNIIAALPLEVTEAAVALSAPASADIGTTITVGWVGPGSTRDTIQLFDPTARQGEGALVRERRLVNDDFDNRTVRIIVPTEPGFYQLRYYVRVDDMVLATREIEVLSADVGISAPASVDMGRAFEVVWTGPGATRDAIEIYDPQGNNGNGRVVDSTRIVNGDFDNRAVKLVAPTEPGDYQLRYWNGDDRTVLATQPIAIAATAVSIAGPEVVDMGRSFVIDWIGPGGNRDTAQVFDPTGNNGNGSVAYEKRLINDDYDKQQVTLIAPIKTGAYELRYWDGTGRSVLASRPFAINPTEVTISAPDTVPAGEIFEVDWIGPGAYRDAIEVMSGDPVSGKSVASGRLVNGDYDAQKARVKAPKEPGDYTLRYWNGEFREVLATRQITVQ